MEVDDIHRGQLADPAGMESIEEALRETKDTIQRLDQEIEAALAALQPKRLERKRAEMRLRLLHQALATYHEQEIELQAGDLGDLEIPKEATGNGGTAFMLVPASVNRAFGDGRGSTSERIRSQVKMILEEADGGPVHINQIRALFHERGWEIPGQGLPGNITAHLTRAEGIFSPRRGFYAIGQNQAKRPSPRRGSRKTKK